jgi:hypothetical protein
VAFMLRGVKMCQFTEECSFFKEFSSKKSLLWKAMINSYCKEGNHCERNKRYQSEGSKKMPPQLMPSGTFASKAFLALP